MLHGLADLEFNQSRFRDLSPLLASLRCCQLLFPGSSLWQRARRWPAPAFSRLRQRCRTAIRLPLSSWTVAALYFGGGFLFVSFLLRVQQTMASAHLHPAGMALRF